MSSAAKLTFLSARLPGFTGRGDKYLGDIAKELRRVLWKTQSSFAFPSCRLPDIAWSDVAVLLVEWAEDIHNDLGLWRAVEEHQRQCFGTPLPLVGAPSAAKLRAFDPWRIQYFLWNLWGCFNPELVLSPTHRDLKCLAEAASRFLEERFARIPRDSGLKRFLSTPNDYGWDIKGKLLWLGINSYLFRCWFFKYLDDLEQKPDIEAKDEFVCGYCTAWAGMGVIDVLAAAIDLPELDRATLRTWYERHRSFFRVLTKSEEGGEVKFITARNVVNGKPYAIRMNMANCPFEPGLMVYGAVTPWRGEWYWSGTQETFEGMPEEQEIRIRKDILETAPVVAYRYCPEEAARAQALTRELHAKFVAYYGDDLVTFPDGLALAAAEQKRMESAWAAASPERVTKLVQERGLDPPRPKMTFPPEFLNHDQGIGAFSNGPEGVEFKLCFNHVISGLRKKGEGLTEEELKAVGSLMTTAVVSPAFVRRLVADHGAESIAETFLLRAAEPELALEFLLRRHKGQFYRKRYPSVSLLQEATPSQAGSL
jgi:hypothetical protein